MGKKYTFDFFWNSYDGLTAAGKRTLYPTQKAFVDHLMVEADSYLEDWFDGEPENVAQPKVRAQLLGMVKEGWVRGAVLMDDDGEPAFGWMIEDKPGRGHVPAWVIEEV